MQTCIANSKPELKILSERLVRENLVEFSVSVKTFTKNLFLFYFIYLIHYFKSIIYT